MAQCVSITTHDNSPQSPCHAAQSVNGERVQAARPLLCLTPARQGGLVVEIEVEYLDVRHNDHGHEARDVGLGLVAVSDPLSSGAG